MALQISHSFAVGATDSSDKIIFHPEDYQVEKLHKTRYQHLEGFYRKALKCQPMNLNGPHEWPYCSVIVPTNLRAEIY